jgi:hypothetical protein
VGFNVDCIDDRMEFRAKTFGTVVGCFEITAGWWFGTFCIFHILGISSSQLTNSYFSEG